MSPEIASFGPKLDFCECFPFPIDDDYSESCAQFDEIFCWSSWKQNGGCGLDGVIATLQIMNVVQDLTYRLSDILPST